LTKIPLTYSVSYFNLEGLELCLGGLSPPKPSRGDGTAINAPGFMYTNKKNTKYVSSSRSFHVFIFRCRKCHKGLFFIF